MSNNCFFAKNDLMWGFTIIELLIVIAIVGGIIVFALSMGVYFFRGQNLDKGTSEVLQALRRSQFLAFAQKLDSPWGVYFSGSQYTLFKGSSYAGRDTAYDEVFDLPSGITPSGISEEVFAKYTGLPGTTGTITLTSDAGSRTITVNGQGMVEQ